MLLMSRNSEASEFAEPSFAIAVKVNFTSSALLRAPDIFPVVEPHMPRDQRPLADLRPHAGDRVGGADRHAGNMLVEPGAHFVAHDSHPLLVVRLDREAIDELVELRVLD